MTFAIEFELDLGRFKVEDRVFTAVVNRAGFHVTVDVVNYHSGQVTVLFDSVFLRVRRARIQVAV